MIRRPTVTAVRPIRSSPIAAPTGRAYREYASDPGQCRQCPQRARCTQSQNHQKLITRHLWQHFKEQIDAHRLTDLGKRLYALRKETVERSFADAKELHGHRYARFRGLAKVQAQCLLSAACQNMKKMALLLARRAAALLSLRFRPAGTLRGVLRRQHIVSIPTSPTTFGRYRAVLVV